MIARLGRDLRSGRISSIELVQQTVAALKNDPFNCLITLMEEEALAEAIERDKELSAGIDRGPLHGIVAAHKDLFYTKGVRTTAGSLVYRDFIPSYDATVIDRLKNAGAICIGKANQHELAYGITSKNPHFGFVLNPRGPTRIPGGSSGGSAAMVAAGYVPMSLGSDTGGSIRIPASYCGVTGLKPTYGRVSRYGVLPLCYSLDHVGPLAASVEDCAITMNAIAGPDPHDETCVNLPATDFNLPPLPHLKQLRAGVPKNFFFDSVDSEVRAAVMKSVVELERLGAKIVELDVPDIGEMNVAAIVIQLAEVSSVYTNHRESALFGKDTWALLERGRLIAGHEYVSAQVSFPNNADSR
jgi:aspartyl-tRNA(Asn)/glutamyl-tRNA(Gln) amidotransferase subunit A